LYKTKRIVNIPHSISGLNRQRPIEICDIKEYTFEIIIENIILKCIDTGNLRWRRIDDVVKYSDILLQDWVEQ